MQAIIKIFLVGLLAPVMTPGQSVTVTSSSPPEAKLAAIDARSPVVQERTVRQYAGLLDDLGNKCKENRVQIGDIAAKGVKLLAEKKVTMSHLKMLQSMDSSIPKDAASLNLSCAEVAAMLVTMINR